jgi:hypothetical protein
MTWQQSLSGEDSEEFADMFLGWTFDTWETNPDGTLTEYGQARSDWMRENVEPWLENW